ncbi:MAG TPA: FAD-dependent oxidoreductase, partial [Anaerovoracaceae bacterium]|nr:FAD-dependent oxidoreductase [Anaerovoracaceae bacterium]
MNYIMGEYDIIVVGAGHAGCEAALASSRMGSKTLILSMNLDAIAMLACNPSIGGTGKGHLVREIDALGGQMGLAIDRAFIQSKMLNTSKGPAVHSLRAQADKMKYHQAMKRSLEQQHNLDLRQGEVVDLIIEEDRVKGVILNTGAAYRSQAVIL